MNPPESVATRHAGESRSDAAACNRANNDVDGNDTSGRALPTSSRRGRGTLPIRRRRQRVKVSRARPSSSSRPRTSWIARFSLSFLLLVSESGPRRAERRDVGPGIVTVLCGSQLPPDRVSHRGHVGPIEAAAAQQHVSDERLDRRFTNQPHEEELLDHLRRDRSQRRQPQQQFAEPRRLVRVLRPAVLLQGALRLLLEGLDVSDVRKTAGVCNKK